MKYTKLGCLKNRLSSVIPLRNISGMTGWGVKPPPNHSLDHGFGNGSGITEFFGNN